MLFISCQLLLYLTIRLVHAPVKITVYFVQFIAENKPHYLCHYNPLLSIIFLYLKINSSFILQNPLYLVLGYKATFQFPTQKISRKKLTCNLLCSSGTGTLMISASFLVSISIPHIFLERCVENMVIDYNLVNDGADSQSFRCQDSWMVCRSNLFPSGSNRWSARGFAGVLLH